MWVKTTFKRITSEKFRIRAIHKLGKLSSILYMGNTFHCNCCGKNFRKFLDKGIVKRPNAKCPYCFSLERTRVLDLYLNNELGLYKKNDIKLLHFAPEPSLFKKINAIKGIDYIDGDIHPDYARNKIDITDIKFTDDFFDLIICSHVLGHVPNEEKAIKELHRVMKPGGTALIMSLLDIDSKRTIEYEHVQSLEDRIKHYGEPDLCRLHGLDLKLRLQNGGFRTEMIDYRKEMSSELNIHLSLGDGRRELIFRCKK